MQTNIQALRRAMLRHIASGNNLQELLVYVDKQPTVTPQQHQLIQQARHALYDCSGSIRAVALEVQA